MSPEIVERKLTLSYSREVIIAVARSFGWREKIEQPYMADEKYIDFEDYKDEKGLLQTKRVEKTRKMAKTREIDNPTTPEDVWLSAIEGAILKVMKVGEQENLQKIAQEAQKNAENEIDEKLKQGVSFE